MRRSLTLSVVFFGLICLVVAKAEAQTTSGGSIVIDNNNSFSISVGMPQANQVETTVRPSGTYRAGSTVDCVIEVDIAVESSQTDANGVITYTHTRQGTGTYDALNKQNNRTIWPGSSVRNNWESGGNNKLTTPVYTSGATNLKARVRLCGVDAKGKRTEIAADVRSVQS